MDEIIQQTPASQSRRGVLAQARAAWESGETVQWATPFGSTDRSRSTPDPPPAHVGQPNGPSGHLSPASDSSDTETDLQFVRTLDELHAVPRKAWREWDPVLIADRLALALSLAHERLALPLARAARRFT